MSTIELLVFLLCPSLLVCWAVTYAWGRAWRHFAEFWHDQATNRRRCPDPLRGCIHHAGRRNLNHNHRQP